MGKYRMMKPVRLFLIKECEGYHVIFRRTFHRRALDYFRQYMIVGGMPQTVAKYGNQLLTPYILHDKNLKV